MTEKKFKHIAAGKEYGIWAAGAEDGTIQTIYGDAGWVGWVEDQIGKADVVAASDWNNMWCVNKDGEIWHYKDGDILWSAGTWTKIATDSGRNDAKTISVGSNGAVWYVQEDGRIFRRDGDSWTQNTIGIAGSIAAVDLSSVWAVNKKNEIWHLTDGTILGDGTWTQVATHSGRDDAQSIAVGPNGTVAYIDTNGTIFSRSPQASATWERSVDQRSMGKAAVVAIGYEDRLSCLNTKGEVWFIEKNGQGQKFVEVLGHRWTYTVKPNDHLYEIVRREFGLKNPTEIDHFVNQIAKESGIRDRDRLKVGDVLTLSL